MIVKAKGEEARYAQWLFQLLGEAYPYIESLQPISELEYRNSFSEAGRSSKIIFFGMGKESGIQGKSVYWRYEKFGMKYGWLGNRCVIVADPGEVTAKTYNTFIDYYNMRIEEFKAIEANFKSMKKSSHIFDNLNGRIGETLHMDEADGAADKIIKTAKNVVLGSPISFIEGLAEIVDNSRMILERGEILKRQYDLLVCDFIINGFQQFMDSASEKDSPAQIIVIYDTKDAEFAHLLHNLIVQHYTEYDVCEYTEKMFLDNCKKMTRENKLIFLGKTKSAKERSVKYNKRYNEYGMSFGWIDNHAFISVDKLKPNLRKDFYDMYDKEARNFDNWATEYAKRSINPSDQIDNMVYITFLSTAVSGMILPTLIWTWAKVKEDADLSRHQYQILLRKFALSKTGLSEFMRE